MLPTGERIAVEVELHAKASDRLAEKLRWYRDAAGYAEVLWLVPGAGVEESLWAAIATVDPEAEVMAVERLPADLLRSAGGWAPAPGTRAAARAGGRRRRPARTSRSATGGRQHTGGR